MWFRNLYTKGGIIVNGNKNGVKRLSNNTSNIEAELLRLLATGEEQMDETSSTHFIGPMKLFVRASKEQKSPTETVGLNQVCTRAAFVSGTHVKQFYEKEIGKEAFEVGSSKGLERKETTYVSKKRRTSFKATFSVNTLMKAVETGNVKDVEIILDGNEDKINIRDQYGWTPLMSACCAGDREMVELLLKWRPQLDVRDKKGNSCRQLASARGHTQVLYILDKYTQELTNAATTEKSSTFDSEQSSITPFYCKTCKQSFENTLLKHHLSSTIHNFNAASKRKMPTMYGIPESNKGFQILLKSGWDKETGLGPSGEGHKFPPKTILKQDRTGLGAKRYKPRVSHTVEDPRREAKPKETYKRKLQSQKRKEQRRERNLREMLS